MRINGKLVPMDCDKMAPAATKINRNRECHIITLEDPIEYLHQHQLSIVNQREIGLDSQNYGAALKAALREDRM